MWRVFERTVSARVSWRIDVSIDGVLSAGREVKWTFPVEIAGGDCLVNSVVNCLDLIKRRKVTGVTFVRLAGRWRN